VGGWKRRQVERKTRRGRKRCLGVQTIVKLSGGEQYISKPGAGKEGQGYESGGVLREVGATERWTTEDQVAWGEGKGGQRKEKPSSRHTFFANYNPDIRYS